MSGISEERLAEIRKSLADATPGPWQWFGNIQYENSYLAGRHSGRPFVMQFIRKGMNGAEPLFADRANRQMVRSRDIPIFEVCQDATSADDPRVYRADIVGFRNPDAALIAKTPEYIADLLAEVDRLRAENERLSDSLTAARDRLAKVRATRDSAFHKFREARCQLTEANEKIGRVETLAERLERDPWATSDQKEFVVMLQESLAGES